MAVIPHREKPLTGTSKCDAASHAGAVKVVDIFGNDTMTIVEVAV